MAFNVNNCAAVSTPSIQQVANNEMKSGPMWDDKAELVAPPACSLGNQYTSLETQMVNLLMIKALPFTLTPLWADIGHDENDNYPHITAYILYTCYQIQ